MVEELEKRDRILHGHLISVTYLVFELFNFSFEERPIVAHINCLNVLSIEMHIKFPKSKVLLSRLLKMVMKITVLSLEYYICTVYRFWNTRAQMSTISGKS